MRQITEEELKENDVLLIVPRNKTHLCIGRSEVANLLYGYVPRELKDGSWQYKVPAYLARDIAKVGTRLTQLAPDAGDSAASSGIVNASAESTSQNPSPPSAGKANRWKA